MNAALFDRVVAFITPLNFTGICHFYRYPSLGGQQSTSHTSSTAKQCFNDAILYSLVTIKDSFTISVQLSVYQLVVTRDTYKFMLSLLFVAKRPSLDSFDCKLVGLTLLLIRLSLG